MYCKINIKSIRKKMVHNYVLEQFTNKKNKVKKSMARTLANIKLIPNLLLNYNF